MPARDAGLAREQTPSGPRTTRDTKHDKIGSHPLHPKLGQNHPTAEGWQIVVVVAVVAIVVVGVAFVVVYVVVVVL